MADVAVLLVLAVTGWLVARADGASPFASVAMALPLGAAVHVAVTVGLVATTLEVAFPLAALGASLALAVLVWWRHRAGLHRLRHGQVVAGGLLVLGIVSLAVAVTSGGLVAISADSFRYLTVAGILDASGGVVHASTFLLESRGLTVGALHALAWGEGTYLAALTPLFAASLLAMVGVAVREAGRTVDRRIVAVVAVAAVLVLALNERFLFNAFYVNGHLFVAGWLLLLQLWVVRRLRGEGAAPGIADTVVLVALVAGIVAARPEGLLLCGLVLLPGLLAGSLSRADRSRLLLSLGLPVLAWQGLVVGVAYVARGQPVPGRVLGLVGLGVAAVALAAAPTYIDRVRPGRWPLLWAHGAVWVALAVFTVRDPGILYTSARATWRNVLFDGGWGSTLVILGVLLVATLVLLTFDGDRALAFTLFTFVPLSMLLAYLREGEFRIGPGDSLNRMLLHVVPIAVFAIAASAFGTRRRIGSPRSRLDRPPEAQP